MPYEPNAGPNDPADYSKLTEAEKVLVQQFISERYEPAKTAHRRTSYAIKHDLETWREGPIFYVSNGAFKGAMLAAGYTPVDPNEMNWRFRIKLRHPVPRQSTVE